MESVHRSKSRFCHAVLLLALCALSACSEAVLDTPLPQRGTIRGTAQLFDLACRQTQDDHTGITATIIGTDHKATTDSNGSWSLGDVASGTYDIELTKEGYEKYILENIIFAGPGELEIPLARIGTQFNTTAILAPPTTFIDSGWSSSDSIYKFEISSSEELPANALIYLAIFVSSTPGIDASDPRTYSAVDMGNFKDGYMGRTVKALRDLAGKQHGTLYVRAYLMGCGFSSTIDYVTQRKIYHGVSSGSEEYRIELP